MACPRYSGSFEKWLISFSMPATAAIVPARNGGRHNVKGAASLQTLRMASWTSITASFVPVPNAVIPRPRACPVVDECFMNVAPTKRGNKG